MSGREHTAAAQGVPLHRGMITLTVMVASILQALDNTIANVALPRMQGSLSATQDQMTWVLTSYIVAAAIMTPLTGWLADRFGRKPLFLASIIGFTLASALCGMAQSLEQIVLFRVLQGLCGAALIPMSQAVLFDVYPPEQHGRAMAIWGMGVVLGPMLGPMLGGWLTEDYSWRWVFYINVPFGILAVLGVMAYFPDTTHARKSFDFFGFALLSIAVGTLQLLLDRGPLKDWFNSGEIKLECGDRGAGVLSVRHAHADRQAAVHPPGDLQGSQFPDRQHPDLRGRHRAVRDAGAAAAAVAGPDGLLGVPGGPDDGAARRRHPDRDAAGRPGGRPHRRAADHRRRPGADRVRAVADDASVDAVRHGRR